MNLQNLKSPNTYFILFSLIVFTTIFTWIIPSGLFDREVVNGREVVVSGSYKNVEGNPQSIDDIFTAPIKGFTDSALIIGFVLIVGGAFMVIQKTDAVNSAIKEIVVAHNKSALVRKILIPILVIIFSLAGAVFGMSEEVIPFILIFVPMALMLGYDSIIGVAIPFVGAAVGFAGAFLNPFTLGIAQGIAEIELFSGWEYRTIVWVIFTTTTIIYLSKYGKKIKNNPNISPTFYIDEKKRNDLDIGDLSNFKGLDRNHKLVLITFTIGMLSLIFGVTIYEWYIEEISAVFVITAIASAIVGKLSINETTDAFLQGAKDLVGTAIVISLARGILVIASDGKIIDTILYNLSLLIDDFHPVVSAQAMFLVQSLINVFVPSGSGQAALTMPIMTPLSDLVGVTRQTAVLAFQLGDGLTNLIIPTSAVTMGVLTLAKIPWNVWAKWMLPFLILLFAVAIILLIPPYFINWA